MNGILNVLKPAGMSSHNIVAFVRRRLNIKKVGHTGTLDPYAAGVLPICIGKATKVSNYLLNDRKAYRAELDLSFSTDTQDAYGEIINRTTEFPDEVQIEEAIKSFIGNIQQVPPMYSALKVNGKKLYDLAREGITIERKARDIVIYNIDIISIKNNKIMMDVECSKGTYIRTLCFDIANKLGCHGHMSFLLRTKTGKFEISTALTLEEIESLEIKNIPLMKIEDLLDTYPKLVINDSYYSQLTNGVKIPMSNVLESEIEYKIYCDNKFLGIGSVHEKAKQYYLKMDKMLVGE